MPKPKDGYKDFSSREKYDNYMKFIKSRNIPTSGNTSVRINGKVYRGKHC